jgi:simple sugar transport system permease protein
MSDAPTPEGSAPQGQGPAGESPDDETFTGRVNAWFATAIGGIVAPIAATVLAFLVGGLVVVATGHNPFGT